MKNRPPHTSDPSFVSGADGDDDDFITGQRRRGREPAVGKGGSSLLLWALFFLLCVAAVAAVAFVGLPMRDDLRATHQALQDALAANSSLHQQIEALEANRATLEQARDNLEHEVKAREKDLEALQKTQEELAEKLQHEMEAGDVTIRHERGELVVDLTDEILFDSGEASLHSRGKQVLRQVADSLKKVPDIVQVRGHTDALPIAPKLVHRFPSNWELSSERATHVVRFLLDECGLPGERLVASGYAQFHPVADNRTETRRRHNRRIELVLVPAAPPPGAAGTHRP